MSNPTVCHHSVVTYSSYRHESCGRHIVITQPSCCHHTVSPRSHAPVEGRVTGGVSGTKVTHKQVRQALVTVVLLCRHTELPSVQLWRQSTRRSGSWRNSASPPGPSSACRYQQQCTTSLRFSTLHICSAGPGCLLNHTSFGNSYIYIYEYI